MRITPLARRARHDLPVMIDSTCRTESADPPSCCHAKSIDDTESVRATASVHVDGHIGEHFRTDVDGALVDPQAALVQVVRRPARRTRAEPAHGDRKSTRLNSSHVAISYAV